MSSGKWVLDVGGYAHVYTDMDGDKIRVTSGVYLPLEDLPELFEVLTRAALRVDSDSQEKGL